MRPSLVFSLLLFFLILREAQGIRLEKGFMQVEYQNANVGKNPLTETRNDGINGEVILCKEGHCTGTNRKLATVTTTISTATSKNEKSGENKAHSISRGGLINGEMRAEHEKVTTNSSPGSGHQEVIHDHYVDNMDMAEMDYSPAKRKPPIHN
uniref:Uncharacterized protein n=1 Tax=Rhizophora mucronata TaxID=61149 RepID=A0A2P2PK79_RHIMU